MRLADLRKASSPYPLLIAGAALLLMAALTQLVWGAFTRGRDNASGLPALETPPPSVPSLPPPEIFLQARRAASPVTNNLFHSPFIDKALASQAALKSSRAALPASEAAPRAANTPVDPAAGKRGKVAAIAPPRLTFQGLILLPEAEAVAMIYSSADNRCAPYGAGESCQGTIIGPMEANQVEITLKDGTTRILARGCPFTIPEQAPHE